MTDLPNGEIQIRVHVRPAICKLSDQVGVAAKLIRAMYLQVVEVLTFQLGVIAYWSAIAQPIRPAGGRHDLHHLRMSGILHS